MASVSGEVPLYNRIAKRMERGRMPVVKIDFRIDASWAHHAREKYRRCLGMGYEFEEFLFLAPTWLEVNDVRLLDWIDTPLYWIAAVGLETVESLKRTRRCGLGLPGTSYELTFQMNNGDTVTITEEVERVSAQVSYAELLNEWRLFADRVRQFLVSKFPDLPSRPAVGGWFRGDK